MCSRAFLHCIPAHSFHHVSHLCKFFLPKCPARWVGKMHQPVARAASHQCPMTAAAHGQQTAMMPAVEHGRTNTEGKRGLGTHPKGARHGKPKSRENPGLGVSPGVLGHGPTTGSPGVPGLGMSPAAQRAQDVMESRSPRKLPVP